MELKRERRCFITMECVAGTTLEQSNPRSGLPLHRDLA
jgi:hypothetical protein